MTKRFSATVLLSVLFLIPACQNSPMTPSTPQEKVLSISLTSPPDATFLVGDTVTLTATATMLDGPKRPITSGEWSSSNPGVAAVDNSGKVTIMGVGTAEITVTYGGKSGSLPIVGAENYRGTWTGTYRIDGCNASGVLSTIGFCGAFTGSGYPIDLVLTEERNEVWGPIHLGSLSGTLGALLGSDGKLRLSGRIFAAPYAIDVSTEIQMSASGEMTGTMSLTYTVAGWTGSGQLMCSIISLNRTNLTANGKASAGMPPAEFATLSDLVNALRGR